MPTPSLLDLWTNSANQQHKLNLTGYGAISEIVKQMQGFQIDPEKFREAKERSARLTADFKRSVAPNLAGPGQ